MAVAREARETTLATAFDECVRAWPERVALFDRDRKLTYAALDARSREIARGLLRRGVVAGTRVGLAIPRSFDVVAAMLAIFRIGAVVVPVDPAWPAARRAMIERDAELALTIDAQMLATLGIAGEELAPVAAEIALDIYTSGSTGEPKAVVLTHGALLWRCGALARAMPFDANEVACHRTSPTFIDAYSEIFGPLLHGVPAFVVPHPLSVVELAAAIESAKITRILLVPSVLALLLDARPNLATLRTIATSGEPLSDALAARCLAAAPAARLVNIYGSTEVAGDATYAAITRDVTIGAPLAGVTTAILDDNGHAVARGEVGELVIGGPLLAVGYLNRPELTAARFIQHAGERMFRTGDRARELLDGRLLLVGRIDDQVKIGGVRVELGEVERALSLYGPSLTTCETVGERTRLVAGVVTTASPEAMRAELERVLPAAAVPSLILRIAAIPMTDHGKADRRALLALVPVVDESSDQIVQWFRELTGQPATADSVFETIGGDSLARLSLSVRLEQAGYHLAHLPSPLTPRTLAQCLATEARRGVALAADEVTDFQRVMVLESLANRGTAMWTDQLAYTLDGPIDRERFAAAWCDVIAAEPALRTGFVCGETIRKVIRDRVEITIDHVDKADRVRVLAEEWTRISLSFDLTTPPLFAVALLHGEERCDLVFTYHHAILDGESARQVLRMVLARYAGDEIVTTASAPRRIEIDPRWRAMFAGFQPTDDPPAPPATGLGDRVWRLFHRVIAIRARLAAARVRRRSKALPLDFTPAVYAGGDITKQPLASPHAAALRTWAAARGVTPNAIWITALALHLARERSTRDVAFGVLVSGRDGRSANAIGMFANCLPLRVQIDEARSIAELVRDVATGLDMLVELAATPLLELAAALRIDPRHFLDTQFISWSYPSKTGIRGGRGITMTAPRTALMVSSNELAVGARELHRTDRVRRSVLAFADAILDDTPIATMLEQPLYERGFSVAMPDL